MSVDCPLRVVQNLDIQTMGRLQTEPRVKEEPLLHQTLEMQIILSAKSKDYCIISCLRISTDDKWTIKS